MNLIEDPWIPVSRADGSQEHIAPWQIAEIDNPVLELKTPRADFTGALYQFLIGLLQTASMPTNVKAWRKLLDQPPKAAELKESLLSLRDAFELESENGPAFLQDYGLPDEPEKKSEFKSVSALFIEAPGDQTLKNNQDLFIKRGLVEQLCPSCAATALFTLQTNAPAGGAGHRVGLRGGGPLTTLIRPQDPDASLWQKLWLNVIDIECFDGIDGECSLNQVKDNARIFPWLAPTRISNKNCVTTPEDVHLLQAYWGMPRRIRLTSVAETGICDVCGQEAEQLYREYRTKNKGVDYDGPWVHPLTPYRIDPKKKELPLSLKGQPGGLGYRHWLGLCLQDESNGDEAAAVVRLYVDQRARLIRGSKRARLWCFGYDMDNMKARCWYDSSLPIFDLDNKQRNWLMSEVGELMRTAREALSWLRPQVKAAWFNRPKDAKGDMSMVDKDFWQNTEPEFYPLVGQLAQLTLNQPQEPTASAQDETELDNRLADIYRTWYRLIRTQVAGVFDRWALEAPAEDLNMQRIIVARNTLMTRVVGGKSMKALRKRFEKDKKE